MISRENMPCTRTPSCASRAAPSAPRAGSILNRWAAAPLAGFERPEFPRLPQQFFPDRCRSLGPRDPDQADGCQPAAITQDVHDKTLPLVDSTVADAHDTIGHVHQPGATRPSPSTNAGRPRGGDGGQDRGILWFHDAGFPGLLAHLTQIAAALHEKLPGILDRTAMACSLSSTNRCKAPTRPWKTSRPPSPTPTRSPRSAKAHHRRQPRQIRRHDRQR